MTSSSKSAKLRSLISSPQVEFLMEAHNGLSAKIVEETGFSGIWASGLSISAQLGVRDNNEASWTQVLEVVEFMADATSIPILLDGDTGYGNFNNARRLVQKLEQRGVAGVCVEDKLFPKTNSFIDGEKQPLADVNEFSGKLRAMKDAQRDSNFVVVARVEALISGWGIQEALDRANAYAEAGADAVLIHSKKSTAVEIEAFMRQWQQRLPVVIVPTKYYSTPTDFFREIGVSTVIWANHNLRSAITAMQQTSAAIFRSQSLKSIEGSVASVNEVFRLQNNDELDQAEDKYLPSNNNPANAIVLAAAQGSASLGELVKDIPKTLLKVQGKTILATQVDKLNRAGIKDVSVVRGFAKDKISDPSLKTIDNDLHAETKEVYSLWLGRNEIRENTIISYGDIVYRGFLLQDLLEDPNDITLVVDTNVEPNRSYYELVQAAQPFSRLVMKQSVKFVKMATTLPKELVCGEFIGLMRVNAKGSQILVQTLDEMSHEPGFKTARMTDLLNRVALKHPISVRYVNGAFLDVNTIKDLQAASLFSA